MNENRFSERGSLTLLSRYAFLAAASDMAMKGPPPPLAPAGTPSAASTLQSASRSSSHEMVPPCALAAMKGTLAPTDEHLGRGAGRLELGDKLIVTGCLGRDALLNRALRRSHTLGRLLLLVLLQQGGLPVQPGQQSSDPDLLLLILRSLDGSLLSLHVPNFPAKLRHHSNECAARFLVLRFRSFTLPVTCVAARHAVIRRGRRRGRRRWPRGAALRGSWLRAR